jgi:alpha-tubulin suppressor-like RCC1 family protein
MKHYLLGILASVIAFNGAVSQNSMIGDGFGGRAGYSSVNYTAGSYSAFTVCGTQKQLYGWGSDSRLQLTGLGTGSPSGAATPVLIPGMNNIRMYTNGYIMTVIKTDNTAWVWGGGNATSGIAYLQPTQVMTDVRHADAGPYNVAFSKFDGSVWGINAYDPPSTFYQASGINTAVRVAENTGGNVDILLSDGTVKRWDLWDASTPPKNMNGVSDVIDVKGNAVGTIALTSTGNVYYASGYFLNTNFNPIIFPSGAAPIKAISGSDDGYYFFALDENGNLYGWYNNTLNSGGVITTYDGVLGINDLHTDPSFRVPNLVSNNVRDAIAGESFSYLVKTDGSMWATGHLQYGRVVYAPYRLLQVAV